MGKEIERKWLLAPGMEHNLFKDENLKIENFTRISDYYFNDNCRLRIQQGKAFITVKSGAGLSRDEYEFEVDKDKIGFLPTPLMRKNRYFINVDGFKYEINIYEDFNINKYPLITVELELDDPNTEIKLPYFCGKEITDYKELYGFSLYKILKLKIDGVKVGEKYPEIINLEKMLDNLNLL